MSKFINEIRIIRFEGPEPVINCEVYENNSKLFSMSKMHPDQILRLTPNSIYRIVLNLKDSNLSVSFRQGLFNEEGMQWLPLFESTEDFLEKQPEDVYEPRILLIASKKHLDCNFETVVTEESSVELELMPEIRITGENTVIIYEDTEQPSFCDDASSKNEGIDSDLLKQQFETEFSSPYYDRNSEKLLEISVSYQENLRNQKRLTDKVIEEIEVKNNELSQAFQQILSLKSKLQRYEAENTYLKSVNSGFLGGQISDLLAELDRHKDMVREMKCAVDRNQAGCGKIGSFIKEECERLKIKPLVKSDEEVFIYEGKKLNVCLKNGKLFYRVGNGYKEFSQLVEENKKESKISHQGSFSKSPFRKPLTDSNRNIETPKLSRASDSFIKAKIKPLRSTCLRKSQKTLKKNL